MGQEALPDKVEPRPGTRFRAVQASAVHDLRWGARCGHIVGNEMLVGMGEHVTGPQVDPPAMLFDLDGTLIDSVYQHVLAWQEALTAVGIDLSVWKLHRRIGMSGGLFVTALLRETGGALSPDQIRALNLAHAEAYAARRDTVRPLPGARELLAALTERQVKWAIATSGLAIAARPALDMLDLPADTPLVTRDQVRHAKPDPDLFLAAAERIGVDVGSAIVVGDSIWDLLAARRARALGVGLLAGGYGREELERAGAYRVYADPADLLTHLDEVGVRGVADWTTAPDTER
jgi:HAD superfamily hydrolase (TIGR01509 family)